jgi:hypothetical protein
MTPIKSAAVAAPILALAACATPNTTLPPGFTGPSAVISDSSYVYSSHKADFFFVEVIDGTKIYNAKERTERVNFGKGLAQEAQAHARPIEAKSSVFHIVGQTHYAAPILSMAGTNYFIEGDVTFTPVVDQHYVVKGSLGPQYQAVWIENAATGTQMGNKLMIKGVAQMGRTSELLLGEAVSKALNKQKPEEIPPPAQ